jgi:hypothetical protein
MGLHPTLNQMVVLKEDITLLPVNLTETEKTDQRNGFHTGVYGESVY